MEIKVYRDEDELSFHYTEDMEPEIVDNSGHFTVYYLGEDEDGDICECVCDYPKRDYYYEIINK